MSGRNMRFRIDTANPRFKEKGFSSAEDRSYEQEIILKDEYNEVLTQIYVRSVGCCGWLEVSDIQDDPHQKEKFDILTLLMEEPLIIPLECWSHVNLIPAHFPLFCVTTCSEVSEWLEKNGWIAWPTWVNPNSGNTCKPYFFPIKGDDNDST